MYYTIKNIAIVNSIEEFGKMFIPSFPPMEFCNEKYKAYPYYENSILEFRFAMNITGIKEYAFLTITVNEGELEKFKDGKDGVLSFNTHKRVVEAFFTAYLTTANFLLHTVKQFGDGANEVIGEIDTEVLLKAIHPAESYCPAALEPVC